MKCCNCKNLSKAIEDGKQYNWCEEILDCPEVEMERDCKHFIQATNADRIRSMTDEELAELFASTAGFCPLPGLDCPKDCKICWRKWLEKEVSE